MGWTGGARQLGGGCGGGGGRARWEVLADARQVVRRKGH